MDRNEQLVNRLTDRHVVADEKDPRHGQTRRGSVVSLAANRLTIGCQQDQRVCGDPLQDHRIAGCRKPNIPDADTSQPCVAAGRPSTMSSL